MYKDSDGSECDLAVMCMREPAWAANQIASLTAELACARALLAEAEAAASVVVPNIGRFVNKGDGTAACAACGFCVAGHVHSIRYTE